MPSSVRAFLVLAAAAGGILASLPVSLAQDRWTAAPGEARIALPAPRGETAVTSAQLACAERRWRLELATGTALPAGSGAATLSVDGRAFEATGEATGNALTLGVPDEALAPLKGGLTLAVTATGTAGEALGEPVFPLRGSRAAIDAAAPFCSAPDMSAYEAVALSAEGEEAELAATLRAEDIAAFRQATASDARVEAGSIRFDGDRQMIFVQLCGSSWYFGRTGCGLSVHLQSGDQWIRVLESEGGGIYIDAQVDDEAYPRLVTLRADAATPTIWRWSGTAYAPLPG